MYTTDVLLTTINQKLYNCVELQTHRHCTNVSIGSFVRAAINCT